ncbi:WXG100 family type VII secretion target [Nocardia lijiangensis]|uniref:WXG100 family type VII secretion target n=1 Tax=Nocardia lijiangensis TaxID=299618 RepID=UPI003D7615B4
MAGQQSFSEKEASEVINEFLDAINGIQTTIGRVQETFDAARSGWQGAAAVAGQQASESWREEAREINKKIDAVKEVVFEGNTTYKQVDPTNVDALTNLI